MNRKNRLTCGFIVAAGVLALLLPSCAGTGRQAMPLDAARQSLESRFPELLESFDLHQGVFSVDEAVWDTLSSAARVEFINRCVEARREVARRTSVRIMTAGQVLATGDRDNITMHGASSVASFDPRQPGEGPDGTLAAEPVLLSFPRPEYPVEARRARIQGLVLLLVRVSPDGTVGDVRLDGAGIPQLNLAAISAARRALFQPLAPGDTLWVRVPIDFSLLPGSLTDWVPSSGGKAASPDSPLDPSVPPADLPATTESVLSVKAGE